MRPETLDSEFCLPPFHLIKYNKDIVKIVNDLTLNDYAY